MLKLSLFIFFPCLVAGCTPIVVSTADSTPPEITVQLPSYRNLQAEYRGDSSNGPIARDGIIIPSRNFVTNPARANTNVQMIFSARDPESGVSLLNASFRAAFRCNPTPSPGVAPFPGTTSFDTDDIFGRASEGEETSPLAVGTLSVSREALWKRSCLRNRNRDENSQIETPSGTIRDIVITYRASALNNARPTQGHSEVSGTFTISDGAVDITE